MRRGLSPEPSASADAEALLDGPVFLTVLLRCPDECPDDDREREHADGSNHYPEEGAHGGSLGSGGRHDTALGQCSGMTPDPQRVCGESGSRRSRSGDALGSDVHWLASNAVNGAPDAAALTFQLLAWITERSRSYGETIEAWKTSCPRMAVWEDALADDLVRVESGRVLLTAKGNELLTTVPR